MTKLKLANAVIGIIILFLGFYIPNNILLHIGLAQNLTMLVFSFLGAFVIFQNGFQTWFKKPQGNVIKTFLIGLFLNISWSIAASVILGLIFGVHGLKENSAVGNLAILPFVPFMIMGEELFSITIFETFKKFTNYGSFVSSIITAVVFGMVHFQTYYGGDVIHTVAHILIIQGVARLFFNWVYAKTKSIWTSWAVHLTFDLIFLILPLLFMK